MALRGLKLNKKKIHNFLRIQSTSGIIMIYAFSHENRATHKIEAFCQFELFAKNDVWVPGNAFHEYVD